LVFPAQRPASPEIAESPSVTTVGRAGLVGQKAVDSLLPVGSVEAFGSSVTAPPGRACSAELPRALPRGRRDKHVSRELEPNSVRDGSVFKAGKHE